MYSIEDLDGCTWFYDSKEGTFFSSSRNKGGVVSIGTLQDLLGCLWGNENRISCSTFSYKNIELFLDQVAHCFVRT